MHMSKLMNLQRKFRAAEPGYCDSGEQLEQQKSKSKSKEQKKSQSKPLRFLSETSRYQGDAYSYYPITEGPSPKM